MRLKPNTPSVEGALASGFVTAELHHPAGHDRKYGIRFLLEHVRFNPVHILLP
jgi:hypothetical protein